MAWVMRMLVVMVAAVEIVTLVGVELKTVVVMVVLVGISVWWW